MTANGAADFVRPILKHFNEQFPETTPFLRGDSSFAVHELYQLCEKESVYYTVRPKTNVVLQRMAEALHPNDSPTGKT